MALGDAVVLVSRLVAFKAVRVGVGVSVGTDNDAGDKKEKNHEKENNWTPAE